jgi:hypothetical protein
LPLTFPAAIDNYYDYDFDDHADSVLFTITSETLKAACAILVVLARGYV